jgi:hypothetical protein
VKGGEMRVFVHFDRYGHVSSLVESKGHPEAPPAGVFPIPGNEVVEVELTEEQAGMSLIDLHTTHRLDTRGDKPQLVPLRRSSRGDRESHRGA